MTISCDNSTLSLKCVNRDYIGIYYKVSCDDTKQ